MSNIGKILNIAFKVITAVGFTCVTIISLASGYILFAPDEFPKPFRLTYFPDTPPAEGVAEVQPEVIVVPTMMPYEPGDGVMFNMATKIINLADTGTRKYIRLTMVLEFAPDNPDYQTLGEEEQAAYMTEFETEIAKVMPIMDDVVITLLSTKTFEDLYTAAGKEALRKELVTAISERVKEYHLISVYFTEFVVQ